MADDRSGRRVKAQHFGDAELIEHDEIGGAADLEPGDLLFFDAAGRHGPEELIKAPMTYLSIIIYPRRT
jgi:hypothetical protein